MKKIVRHFFILVTSMISLIVLSSSAQADASCANLLASVSRRLDANQWINVYLSQHRQDSNWGVQYSAGFLAPDVNGGFTGRGTEYFSIRTNSSQIPFTGDSESLNWTMNSNGVMNIHNDSWNFNFNPINFSCYGNLMSANIPGDSIFTLSFGSTFTPIQ